MLGLVILIASCISMYKIAEMGDRRGWAWAILTFIICTATASLIPLPIINIGAGFVLTWMIMVAVCMMSNQHA